MKESSDRVMAAIKNTNLDLPVKRITVNLAPANIKKEGSAFDLPIALGICAANHVLRKDDLEHYMILGELSLDGRVKPIKGCAFHRCGSKERKASTGYCFRLKMRQRPLW